jgi:archaellum component FlaC
MGSCEIPVNIALRRSELEALSERLDRINEDFADLRQADEDFDGDSASEQEIKRTIQRIENTLRNFEQERKDMFKYQTNPLEKYGPKDFTNFTLAPKIIV